MSDFNLAEELTKTPQYKQAHSHAINDNRNSQSLANKEYGRVVNNTDCEAWPEPEPFTREFPPADPYPITELGEVLAEVAGVLRDIIQAPAALCAQSILAGAALAVQAHANVEIDGRVIPTSENFISVGKSGERKTATDKAALAPHAKRQHDLQQEGTRQMEEYCADLLAWKKARDIALASKKPDMRAENKEALLRLGPEPQGPIDTIITTEEPTHEGLVKALACGWPSMGLFSDEGGRFIGGHGMSQENQLKTIAGLSKLWDGAAITRTRGGDGNILLYGRRLSLHLMMQPEVSTLMFGNPLLVGQGFLSRCLVTYPQSTIGYQPYKEANLYEDVRMKRYFARLSNILEAPLPLAAGTRNELVPRCVRLAPDAKRIWILFHDHIQMLMRPEQPLAPIQGLAAKAAEHGARLAGILALIVDLHISEIAKVHVEAGIELVQFYLSEALRLFHSSAINPDLLLAEKLLLWAQMRGGNIYLRVVYQYGPNAIRDKVTARRIIAILEDHGWLRPIQGGAEIDGAHRREVWQVRP